MAGVKSDSDDMIVGINVTPLVDVVLVLLVIFMITAPVLYHAAISVDLPKAKSGQNVKHVTLRFSMLADGKIALGSDIIKRSNVPSILANAIKQDPTANAIVAADKNLTHGAVVSFIDLLKQAGLTHLGIAVDSPAPIRNVHRQNN